MSIKLDLNEPPHMPWLRQVCDKLVKYGYTESAVVTDHAIERYGLGWSPDDYVKWLITIWEGKDERH